MRSIPRIIIAGTQSGVGKTSFTLGLVTLLRQRGLRVQTFKVGPDYLDPGYLALASGRTCYNLDGWMMGHEYVEALFARATVDVDIAVIEGVMGLYDGASPDRIEGSTAEIAQWLQAPVILVANAHGMARSFAAMVDGYVGFEPGVTIAGVVANRCGSTRHAEWLSSALRSAQLPALVGTIQRDALPALSSRHLGLVTADARSVSQELLEQLAKALASGVNLDAILECANAAPGIEYVESRAHGTAESSPVRVRLGVARDEAFHFYYADNLEALERAGCELHFFSPIHDSKLPENVDGLYFGGGYPEESASLLSRNETMLRAVRNFASEGGVIYAECGGLMYLSEGIALLDGTRHSQAGVLPGWVKMESRRRALGYVEVSLTEESLWGRCGDALRGHEFHYSTLEMAATLTAPWKAVYQLRKRGSDAPETEGYASGRVLASYAHLHWASNAQAVDHFISQLKKTSALRASQAVPVHV